LRTVNPKAAGVDVGAEEHWVAIPPELDETPVRKFGAYTVDLESLADWLKAKGIETIAMESTGVYWIPLYELLEARGFEVKLVDPRRVKNVPGRKTDVLDCQWIQKLHGFGLLNGAYRPPESICELRAYVRQRGMLVGAAGEQIQHMQKSLTQMNIKLQHVLRDVTGVTGLRILRALLSGERDARKLAGLRHERCQHSTGAIAKALQGNWREEHLFTLRQAVELYDIYQEKIAACEREIDRVLEKLGSQDEEQGGGVSGEKECARETQSETQAALQKMTGVDLTQVPGLDTLSAVGLVSEIGVDMRAWADERHFASWLGLCPGNKVSGGKRMSGRTRKCANRAAQILRLAARSLQKTRSALGAFYRRMRSRLGAPKAITATAHKLAHIVYGMLRESREYVEVGQDHYEREYKKRVLESVRRKAAKLGYNLVQIQEMIQPKTA